jgi:hypothetical protein
MRYRYIYTYEFQIPTRIDTDFRYIDETQKNEYETNIT